MCCLSNKSGLQLDCHSFIWCSFDTRLGHQVVYALLQVIDSIAHVVDSGDYLVGHRLELVLDILQ